MDILPRALRVRLTRFTSKASEDTVSSSSHSNTRTSPENSSGEECASRPPTAVKKVPAVGSALQDSVKVPSENSRTNATSKREEKQNLLDEEIPPTYKFRNYSKYVRWRILLIFSGKLQDQFTLALSFLATFRLLVGVKSVLLFLLYISILSRVYLGASSIFEPVFICILNKMTLW